MKSKKQFILDTLLPYKENPKSCAIGDDGCMYLMEDGRKCAVGKHMLKGEWQSSMGNVECVFRNFGEKKVLKKYAIMQKLTNKQWCSMQAYHDMLARHIDLNYQQVIVINSHVRILERSLGIELDELYIENSYD
jgi:hypothetical protein